MKTNEMSKFNGVKLKKQTNKPKRSLNVREILMFYHITISAAVAKMVEWSLNVFSRILGYNCFQVLFNKILNPK